ncbi:MAG: class I SAM-dependent methyltransferase [Caldilineaceae bacterium]|nr:class I SAM-dependent methyltransferase [Caldilineaceae bacterium]MBP8108624.1 class I SAM-dependent methyltransferase [Caldilineaceae bacterium]MBP8123177.1 class I SAM-dependent methyltransferase [Caldilineaceae bacterium]MBP9072399.1 class I SAM-dependent methyltransferase [Caldilineaceae bacterium]
MWRRQPGHAPLGLVGDQLPYLYRVEDHHWWSRGMREIGLGLLDGVTLPPGPVAEIGCGSGAFLADLGRRWPDRTRIGLDLRGDALAHARLRGPGPLVQADVGHLPLADQSCALVVGLDVFDQSGVELIGALRSCRGLLRPGGVLLFRVSALPWLASPHDAAFGTARRHHAHEIRHALAAAGLAPVRLTHANSLLLPLAAANRHLQRLGLAAVDSGFQADGPLNTLGHAILAGEAQIVRRWDLPIGSSLFCLAR